MHHLCQARHGPSQCTGQAQNPQPVTSDKPAPRLQPSGHSQNYALRRGDVVRRSRMCFRVAVSPLLELQLQVSKAQLNGTSCCHGAIAEEYCQPVGEKRRAQGRELCLRQRPLSSIFSAPNAWYPRGQVVQQRSCQQSLPPVPRPSLSDGLDFHNLYLHLPSMASMTLHHPLSQSVAKALAGNQGSAAKPKKLTRPMGRPMQVMEDVGLEVSGSRSQRTASGFGQVTRGGISIADVTGLSPRGPNSGPLRPGRRAVAETRTGDSDHATYLGHRCQRKLGQTAGRPREAQ